MEFLLWSIFENKYLLTVLRSVKYEHTSFIAQLGDERAGLPFASDDYRGALASQLNQAVPLFFFL